MQCGFLLTAFGTLLFFLDGVLLSKALASRPPGYLDFDNLPETNFTCEGKVIGGYYADIETGCQMFHVCTIGQKGDMTDIKFLCLNGTVFDQETRVCERVDEVDCSKSKDFYDLNLELYNSGFLLSEEEGDGNKNGDASDQDDEYDENYDSDTEEPPLATTVTTTSKGSRTSAVTSTTSSTTSASVATTPGVTSRPTIVYTTSDPGFRLIIPSSNVKHGPLSQQRPGYDNKNVRIPTAPGNKPVPSLGGHGNYQGFVQLKHQHHQPHHQHHHHHHQQQPRPSQPQQQQAFENKNIGTHLTGLVPIKNLQTPRPYAFATAPGLDRDNIDKTRPSGHGQNSPLPSGFSARPTTGSYKPPSYETYKNHYFPSSTPGPVATILVENYKPHGLQEIRPSEQANRPVVVIGHHFPTVTPAKTGYDELVGISGPSGPPQTLYPIRGSLTPAQITGHSPKVQHQHKANPTILALQSQQKKVHRLHQEGLEIAEHRIAQIASRNAEISNLRSQKSERKLDDSPGNEDTFSKPSVAVVASTSSTSSRIENKPVIAALIKTATGNGPIIAYKPEQEYKTDLEKLFAAAERDAKQGEQRRQEEAEDDDDEEEEEDRREKGEDASDMDLEQLLLAWKLKTNQEVTREDIERVFSSLDTSKFKNGQTISLSDIFEITRNASGGVARPPTAYADYVEEDVPYDPFYEDVPKVPEDHRRGRRSSDPTPHLSLIRIVPAASLPVTTFSCEDKVPGGLYADTELDCRLFHVCSDAGNGSLADHKFLCEEKTKFNQKSRTCEAKELVDCRSSSQYYQLNEDFRVSTFDVRFESSEKNRT